MKGRAPSLDRYAASDVDFVPVAPEPHSGPRRAKRAKEILLTRRGLCRDIKGRALGWFQVSGRYASERQEANMSLRYLAPLEILAAVTLAVSVAVPPVAAQAPTSASVRGTTGISTAVRTPWGDPDLQGVWTNTTVTPLERPESVARKEVLTDEERAELDAQAAHTLERLGGTGAYNDFWLERGRHSRRTSLIIDPPDGTLPPVTPRAKQQADARTAVSLRRPASWEDVSMYDRC